MRKTGLLGVLTPGRNLFWYAKRLRVMRPAEVIHRVAEQCTVKVLEVRHRLGRAESMRGGERVDRFSFCVGSTKKLPHLPWVFHINDETAEQLLSGKLSVLGHEWTWRPHHSVWHEAPDTDREWPQRFFSRISYREGNPYGDVRVAWEPSRLQQLVALALLAERAEPSVRRRAVALLERQFLSWIDANPFLTGIHYISMMECGLRLLAVCHAFDLVREWVQDSDRVWPALVSFIHGHAELISQRLSVHSSAGNHTIAEATGLVYAGSLFPEMAEAQLWRSVGLSLLEQEAPRQILKDGGGAEQSLWYQRFISDLYGLVVVLLEHHRSPVSVIIADAFHRSQRFLHAFNLGDGTAPLIGDGDSGYALSPFLQFSSTQKTQMDGLTSFEESGYSIVREASSDQSQMIFDHGPLGLAPCYAHGHADALSVILSVHQKNVLLDPGTYTYTGDRAWRRYFRGTRAHNTVCVDHMDQAVQETTFMWAEAFLAQAVFKEETADGSITILARHHGYEKRTGVTHWRAVLYAAPCSWLIWDRLTGDGDHHLELNWHLAIAPRIQAGLYVLSCGKTSVHLAVEGGTNALHCGEVEPPSGWWSHHYGVRQPISTLRTEYVGSLPHEFLTHITIGVGTTTGVTLLERLSKLRSFTDGACTY